MEKLYTEADVERFIRDALEAAAKRCEQMADTCAAKAKEEVSGSSREWLVSRSAAARDCAFKIRKLEVTRKA